MWHKWIKNTATRRDVVEDILQPFVTLLIPILFKKIWSWYVLVQLHSPLNADQSISIHVQPKDFHALAQRILRDARDTSALVLSTSPVGGMGT